MTPKKVQIQLMRSACKSLAESFDALDRQAKFMAVVAACAPDHHETLRTLLGQIEQEKGELVENFIEAYVKVK